MFPEFLGNCSGVLFSSLQANSSATRPPTSALYLAGSVAHSTLSCWPLQEERAVGGPAPPPAPTPKPSFIRAASVRLSIVLALTLTPVHHWFLSGGRRGDGEGASVEEEGGGGLHVKGLFQRGSMDQRKECLYCDWEMRRAGEKNGRPAERAACQPGLAGAPQLDPVSPEPIRAENNQAASADNLRSPERNSEWATGGLPRVGRGAVRLAKKSF